MTMLGLILAIGIVIDDAVVINENIFRHMEEDGVSAMEAASSATKEISLAVSATTLSLLVIFIPIVFMGGRIGRFFSSFGATVAFAILMSWFVSFTMTPMLCSRFLKRKTDRSHSKEGRVWRAIDGLYGWVLRWSLRHRWVIVVTTVSLLVATVFLFKIVGFDFIPRDDQSEFEVAMTLPEGYTLTQADKLFAEIEGRIAKLKGVTNVFTTIGDTTGRVSRGQGDVTKGTIYARLTDLEERTRKWYDWRFWYQGIFNLPEADPRYFSQFDVQRDARELMTDYRDLRTAVQDAAVVSGAGFRQAMVDLNLRGPDLNKLQEYSERVVAWMKQHPDYVDIDTSLSLRKPELRVKIDRERASDLGISVQTIASMLNVLVGGEPVTKYKEIDEQYDVWLRAELPFRDRPDAIGRLMIPSAECRTRATVEPWPRSNRKGSGHDRPVRHDAASRRHGEPGRQQALGQCHQ